MRISDWSSDVCSSDLLLDGERVDVGDVAAVLRQLPQQNTFNVEDVTVMDKDVSLVLPQRSAAKVVGRELAACGYSVSTVLNPIEALELILETRPDLVITAQRLEEHTSELM